MAAWREGAISSDNGHKRSVTIAVDAMGGDHGPDEVVRGARMAVESGVKLVLVGRLDSIEPLFEMANELPIVDAPDVIGMHESPTVISKRPDSSLARAIAMVSSGDADGAVSAGNSGAIMAGALLNWGRQSGVLRPAYGGEMPTRDGHTFILDIGANADVKPEYLLQFAVMGAAYMQVEHGMRYPRIGLLSNGTEDGKGTAIIKEAHELLQRQTDMNYAGNIEANQVFEGAVDICVTDGFTGNILLKTAEGVAEEIFNLIRGQVNRDPMSKIGAKLMQPAFRRIKRRLDYEEYGGAPLLGVNGVMINAHGRSRAKAIANAIQVACKMADQNLNHRIGEELSNVDDGDAGRSARVIRKLHLPRRTRVESTGAAEKT
jgi:glycerol-3-phosphate acyltransferase PlsX